MVTNDKGKFCKSDITAHIGKVIETFASFGMCRSLCLRKAGDDLCCKKSRIDHNVLGFTRMDIDTVDDKVRACSVKVLVSNFAFVITVNCVSKVCFKIVKIKEIRTCTDFFVRGKAYPYITVRCTLGNDLFQSSHDLCNTCFIVSTEKRGSVGRDKCASGQRFQSREIRYLKIGVTSF